MARELVAYFARRGKVLELIKRCEELRPSVAWAELIISSPLTSPDPSGHVSVDEVVDTSQEGLEYPNLPKNKKEEVVQVLHKNWLLLVLLAVSILLALQAYKATKSANEVEATLIAVLENLPATKETLTFAAPPVSTERITDTPPTFTEQITETPKITLTPNPVVVDSEYRQITDTPTTTTPVETPKPEDTPLPIVAPSPHTVAEITTVDGTEYFVPANFLFYGISLTNGLILKDGNVVPFTEMKHLEVEYVERVYTTTITLWNNERIIARPDTYSPKLYGPTEDGTLTIWLSQVEQISFNNSFDRQVDFATVEITSLSGSVIVAAAYLEAQYSRGSYLSAPSYSPKIDLANGEEIQFRNINQIEIHPEDQSVTITLRDGRVKTGQIGRAFALRGPTDLGILNISIDQVLRVVFNW